MEKNISEIWGSIERKSQQWHEVMTAELGRRKDKNSCAKGELLSLAQIAKSLFSGNVQKLRLFVFENRHLLLNASEMAEIDNLDMCKSLHSAVTIALEMTCRAGRFSADFSIAKGGCSTDFAANGKVWGYLSSDWHAEIYVKHPFLKADYPVLLQRGIFFVHFDVDFPPEVECLQHAIEEREAKEKSE